MIHYTTPQTGSNGTARPSDNWYAPARPWLPEETAAHRRTSKILTSLALEEGRADKKANGRARIGPGAGPNCPSGGVDVVDVGMCGFPT